MLIILCFRCILILVVIINTQYPISICPNSLSVSQKYTFPIDDAEGQKKTPSLYGRKAPLSLENLTIALPNPFVH